ncbi:Virulence-associated protein D [Metamycoplasma arthritidis]|uniref:Virulence-associated protein D n=1 Tax=Metamycoplasma arthritidis (strain 158L3-1) TaxID=243272 RepID=B3PLY2_META1|nr:virulence-associated protein D [Metamycoplasma arthritidis]ACF07034.1 virulence-associated protein D [Metamycoplasma arthritidis 158L3-1]VEU78562.1 Virulence-associated protein D [Metamycoplasma arthritidis]
MYGLVFYLSKEVLKKEYGMEKNHHDAYEEIRDILRHYGFHWLSNSFYFSRSINNLVQIFQAVKHLKEIPWFVKSLGSFHVFKMEDMSNFTEYIKSSRVMTQIEEEEEEDDIELGKTKNSKGKNWMF